MKTLIFCLLLAIDPSQAAFNLDVDGAELWDHGAGCWVAVTQRRLVTPVLPPGRYHYRFRFQGTEQSIDFRPGEEHNVTFPPVNYGLDASRIGNGYSISGKPVTRDEARKIVKDGLPDYSKTLRVVCWGEGAGQFADSLRPHCTGMIVEHYPADAWQIRTGGYRSATAFGMSVVDSKGVESWHQETTDLDAAKKGIAKLRKPDGTYDPAKSPGPLDGFKLPFELNQQNVLIGAAGLVILLLLRKRNAG
jgi:hypothetical protein